MEYWVLSGGCCNEGAAGRQDLGEELDTIAQARADQILQTKAVCLARGPEACKRVTELPWSTPLKARPSGSQHFLQDRDLRKAKDNDLADRRTAAADAKAALLRKHQATKDAAEPTRLARQAERLAVATARDERHQERDRLKLEELARQKEQERIQAEAAEYQTSANVAARAQAEAREKTDNMIARVISDEAARKAERDQRYANRKARQ